jgi:hypothetical protein
VTENNKRDDQAGDTTSAFTRADVSELLPEAVNVRLQAKLKG